MRIDITKKLISGFCFRIKSEAGECLPGPCGWESLGWGVIVYIQ